VLIAKLVATESVRACACVRVCVCRYVKRWKYYSWTKE